MAEVALPRHYKELERDVIEQVLGYFVRNRKTADTLEGVTRWRLSEERVHKSLRQTEAAIGWLVEQGYLEEVVPAGSNAPIFRLKPERRDDAVRFLTKPEGRKTGLKTHREN